MARSHRRSNVTLTDLRLRDDQPGPYNSGPQSPLPAAPGDPLTIFVPGVPRNANARGEAKYNRWDKAKFRKRSRDIGAAIAWGPHPFIVMTAQHVSPVRRRRDPLGLAERLKGVVDGFVDSGLLIDDDEDHLEVHLAHSVKGQPAGLLLTFTPKGRTNHG